MSDSSDFILTDNNGGFYYHNQRSRFGGLHTPLLTADGWDMLKTVECIRFDRDITRMRITQNKVIIGCNSSGASFSMAKGAILIKTHGKLRLQISLDVRKIYDFSDSGRFYYVHERSGCHVIEYKKFGPDRLLYTAFIAIKTDGKLNLNPSWTERFYPDESNRHSSPDKLWVYDCISLETGESQAVISAGIDFDHTLGRANRLFDNFRYFTEHNPTTYKTIQAENETNMGFLSAQHSLHQLECNIHGMRGIYAGLPWFWQYWTRDEAFCLGAHIRLERFHIVKKIIMDRLQAMNAEGIIPNRHPGSILKSADGTGLVFFRAFELLSALERKNLTPYLFSKEELLQLKGQLDYSISKTRTENLLVRNGGLETWMDTGWQDDNRDGYRIEIQALWLRMLGFRNFLDNYLKSKHQDHLDIERKTLSAVRKNFFELIYLKDGKDDRTIRPNIFLAHYFYPYLLYEYEWSAVFERALKSLWLDWGGLSTIDKSSSLFCNNYSGEDNRSYHRGDSWFFINNIAAMCMSRVDHKLFETYINSIINASVKDVLYMGTLGACSELSSAREQLAQGSPVQAWSAATLVELLAELHL